MSTSLTFDQLRAANIARLPEFKNVHGEGAHSAGDGSDWSPAQWLQALVGEIGEFANFRKKYERGDITIEEFEVQARKELADVQTYLDILAMRCLDTKDKAHPTGVNLGDATADKFNAVSRRVGSNVFLLNPNAVVMQDFPVWDQVVVCRDEADRLAMCDLSVYKSWERRTPE